MHHAWTGYRPYRPARHEVETLRNCEAHVCGVSDGARPLGLTIGITLPSYPLSFLTAAPKHKRARTSIASARSTREL